jgi:hypothetical protein
LRAHPLSAERLRRAAVLPTLLAAVRLAPLRDAALSALGVLARQSARVRDALKPLDGLAAFADVLRDGGASEATLALAAWCAASAMIDASVRDDAIACQLPEALAAHMASSNVVLSARTLEAFTRLLEGPDVAAKRVLHLKVIPVLIKPIVAMRDSGAAVSPLVLLAVRGLHAAVRSGLGKQLAQYGVTAALVEAVRARREHDAALAHTVAEIVGAL